VPTVPALPMTQETPSARIAGARAHPDRLVRSRGRVPKARGGAQPPVPRQGARRVWSDSHGALWITGWNTGDLFRYDSKTKSWAHWHLPSHGPQPYALYVDETDSVWVNDWGANAILRLIPKPKNSSPFRCPIVTPACGSLRAAGAKFGVPSSAPISCSC
jgi:virginiamycin B lyase